MCVLGGKWSRRTHKDEEEGKASVVPRCLQTQRVSRVSVLPCHLCGIGDVGAVCVEGGDEGAAEGEPEGACGERKGYELAMLLVQGRARAVRWKLTKSAKDDKGEGVANDPFANGS